MIKLKNIISATISVGFLFFITSCGNTALTRSGIDPAAFDTTINGKQIQLYTLTNKSGMEVCVTNYGARVISILVADKNKNYQDIALGYDNIKQYTDSINRPNTFGAPIGQYSNIIKHAKINIDGKPIQLKYPVKGQYIDGGAQAWQYKVYDVISVEENTIKLQLKTDENNNDLPSATTNIVTYTLTDNNELDVNIETTANKTTLVNATFAPQFNLSGNPTQPCTNMVLYVNADKYTPIDSSMVVTGERKEVYGTPLNFNKAHALYESIADTSYQQIKYADGYNHNFCLNTYKGTQGDITKVAATLYSPDTGIFMQIFTNQPGMQVATTTDTNIKGKRNMLYVKHAAIALCAQPLPYLSNSKAWKAPIIKANEKYINHTIYKFSTK